MFERISNGWELAKQSWSVLKMDKELLVFPLLSGLSCLAILATFAIPIVLNFDRLEPLLEDRNNPLMQALMWIGLFLYYFVNYFVVVFFNSALVACAIIRFRGGDPTVKDGLQAALSRLPQILAWALVSATVGIILKAIETRSNKLGEFVAGLLGGAWTIVTYFVVPVLVVERAGPATAVKRSFEVIRKAWGESLVAGFSVGLIAILCSIAAIIPLVVGAFLLSSDQVLLGGVLIVVGVLCLLVINLITTTLDSILLSALYLYAADGEVPNYFSQGSLSRAFHAK